MPDVGHSLSQEPLSLAVQVSVRPPRLVIFTVCFGVVASRWSFGDGSPDTTARYVAHAYTAPGTYPVVLTVTDDRGGWAAVSHSVEAVVSNSPPQAGFTSACAGLTCTFSDGSFDYDGTVVGYHWTFGDGESADGPHPVHTYAAPGVYHCVNSGSATWEQVARELAGNLGIQPNLDLMTMEQVQMKASRPRFCALATDKIAAAGFPMPSWQDAIGRWLASRNVGSQSK